MKPITVITLLGLLWLLAACASPAYYTQAISGHMKLMNGREDVESLLAESSTDPGLAEQLQLAQEVRAFAISTMELPDTDSYTSYAETGRDAVTWNVIAAPEFSLRPHQWCFLVSGCVAYRGYFEREDARRYADKLAQKGYDVALSPAIAYSTLGWFDDPLLDTMLNHGEPQLAAFLMHEMAHQKLYVKGDTAFNEAYASFVEEQGTRLWLMASERRQALLEWEKSAQASDLFQQLLLQTRGELNAIYQSSQPEAEMRTAKAETFARLQANYQELAEEEWNGHDYYAGWFSQPLNNARLALLQSYQGGICAFEALYQSANEDISSFHRLAAEKAALGTDERRRWLEQGCPGIASNRDL